MVFKINFLGLHITRSAEVCLTVHDTVWKVSLRLSTWPPVFHQCCVALILPIDLHVAVTFVCDRDEHMAPNKPWYSSSQLIELWEVQIRFNYSQP